MSKQGFLKGLIFKAEASEQGSTENPSQKGKVTKSPVMPVSTTTVQGVADNKFIELLENMIEQNNQPGQDYFEFKQAVENMNSLPMDEKTKFQTVYTVLSLQGCKKETLIASLDKYIQLIQGEKASFDEELTGAVGVMQLLFVKELTQLQTLKEKPFQLRLVQHLIHFLLKSLRQMD